MVDVILIYSNSFIETYIIKELTNSYKILNVPYCRLRILNKILSKLFFFYIFIYLKWTMPKICITFIDNSALFQKLIIMFPSVNFFAIQNGNRTKKELLSNHKNKLSNYFCFGKYEKDTFKEFGHYASNFIPVGSLKAGIYKSINNNKIIENKYDICFVSQWKDSSLENLDSSESEEIFYMKKIDSYLKKFINKRQKTLCIAMRSEKNSLEFDYYKNYYKDKAFIQPRKNFSTYEMMEKSNTIITFYSTAGVEGFGWLKKVLFIDYSKENKYNYFKPGPWLLTKDGYANFEKYMDNILNMSYKNYNERYCNYAGYLMNYDPINLAHEKIKNELKSYL